MDTVRRDAHLRNIQLMMKEENKFITVEWILSLILFNIVNLIVNLMFEKFPDWELFTYHLFYSFLSYFISCLLQLILNRIFHSIIKHRVLCFLSILFCLEISFLLTSGISMSYTILKFAWSDENYMMIFYPISILIIKIFMINRRK